MQSKIAQARPPARQVGIGHPRRIRGDAGNPTFPEPGADRVRKPAYVTWVASETGGGAFLQCAEQELRIGLNEHFARRKLNEQNPELRTKSGALFDEPIEFTLRKLRR